MWSKRTRHWAVTTFGAIALALAGVACGLGMSDESCPTLSASCGLAQDQRCSFQPKLPQNQAATVVVDPSFTPSERSAIQREVDQWNALASKELGRLFFQVAVRDLPESGKPSSATDCGFTSYGPGVFQIRKITDQGYWNSLHLTATNPGVTIRCRAKDTVERQIILINPQNVSPMQLGSVIGHELGHAVGLKHSCDESSDSEFFLSCEQVKSANHPYRVAMMYPWLSAGSGLNSSISGLEIKEDLRTNDMERATCLYKP